LCLLAINLSSDTLRTHNGARQSDRVEGIPLHGLITIIARHRSSFCRHDRTRYRIARRGMSFASKWMRISRMAGRVNYPLTMERWLRRRAGRGGVFLLRSIIPDEALRALPKRVSGLLSPRSSRKECRYRAIPLFRLPARPTGPIKLVEIAKMQATNTERPRHRARYPL
jgi:hypothetical protein